MNKPETKRKEEVVKIPGGAVVKMQTTVRLSKNYQSSENLVGVDLPCKDTPEEIASAFKRGWQIIDEQLAARTEESRRALDYLGGK